MITKKQIKEIANSLNKKISKEAQTKIGLEIEKIIKEKLKDASINADFESRKIIQEKDLDFS